MMKKVSAKLFFMVVWKGFCQTIEWILGLFGYKGDGKLAKCLWRICAICGTIIMLGAAVGVLYCLGYEFYQKNSQMFCNGKNCDYWTQRLSTDILLHDHLEGHKEVINTQTGKVILKDIDWVMKPIGEKDSLAVFSDGKKRGYFNLHTGEVVIPAKFEHAWVFSDGIASVCENGRIKFIDSNGNQAFDRTFAYNQEKDGYVFHGGYCIVKENEDGKYGLMNIKGETVLPEEYSAICYNEDNGYWTLNNGEQSGVIAQDLNPILPMLDGFVTVWNDVIDVTMADHTMRKYDLQGNLIDDFYITYFEYLEYEQEETYQVINDNVDGYGTRYTSVEHKKARAHLYKYSSGGKEGLMTPEGHAITLPKYDDIVAIGPDTYLCDVSHGDKEILNGKGQKVK